ncbi:MAG: hypothetical protein ABI855_07765, partial [Bacteroidota bacterium]
MTIKNYFTTSSGLFRGLCSLLIILGLWTTNSFGQVVVTGGTTATAGSPYGTLSAAITAINLTALTGAVNVAVVAGYTETIPVGGILIGSATLNASMSATNTLTIIKSGAGANPLLTSFVGTSTTVDGMVKIVGTDYVTIDGIDLVESGANLTATTQMEWGYALVKRQNVTPFDGCQFNTIQNCTITLNRTNTVSKGIYVANHIATSTTSLTITAVGDANSNNKFYTNTVTNCFTGIYINGYANASPYTLYDQSNDVGGVAASTGNTITNYGGSSATCYGVYNIYQNLINVSYNTINNAGGGGVGHVSTGYGIFCSTAVNSTVTYNNNTVTLTSAASAGSAMYGINSAATGSLGLGSTTVSGNTIAIVTSSAVTGTRGYIYCTGSTTTETITNNIIADATVNTINTTGTVYLIYASNATPTVTISGNSINTGWTRILSGSTYGTYNFASPTSGTHNINNNNFSNITTTGTGTLYGIYWQTNTGPTQNIFSNTVSNLSTGLGAATVYGIAINYTNSFIYNNTVTDIATGSSVAYGIQVAGASTISSTSYNNKVCNISATGAAGIVYGMAVVGGTGTQTLYNNVIGNLSAPSSTSALAVEGIYITAGTTVNCYYNTVYMSGTMTAAGSTAGIWASTTPTVTLINNLVVNKIAPTGAGISAAYRRSSTTLTTYGASSDRNLWYAGAPSATTPIYYDGTAYQTLANYQALVGLAPREANSQTEDPTFLSTTCGDPDFL